MAIGPVRVDMQFGGVWTNVTSDVYTQERIHITRGRQDEASSVEACALALSFNNRSGNYTPSNPMGSHYGSLKVGTPIRVGIGVPPIATFATSPGGSPGPLAASNVTTEAAGLLINVTTLASANPGSATLVASGSLSPTYASQSGNYSLSVAGATTTGAPGAYGSAFGATSGGAAGGGTAVAATIAIPGPVSTSSIIIEQQAVGTNTPTGNTPTALLSPFNVLAGDVLVAVMAWSSDASNAMYGAPLDFVVDSEWELIGDSGPSSTYARMQVWVRQCPRAVSALQPGFFGHVAHLEDLQVTAFQVRGATAWAPRFHGEAVSFTSTADLSGKDVRTAVAAGNVVRRRGQGQDPAHSALYRSFAFNAAGVVAYWPLETNTALNQQGVSVLNSPLPGVAPASFAAGGSSVISYGATSTIAASESLPTIQNGVLSFPVPTYTSAVPGVTKGSGLVTGVFQFPSAPNSGCGLLLIKLLGGTAAGASYIQVAYTNSTTLTITVYDINLAVLLTNTIGLENSTSTGSTSFIGTPFAVAVSWFVNNFGSMYLGMNTINMSGTSFNAEPTLGFSALLGPISALDGRVASVTSGVDVTNTILTGAVPVTVGHITVSSQGNAVNLGPSFILPVGNALPTNLSYAAFVAWGGEDVGSRILRLCQEESIPTSATALNPGRPGTALGPQVPDTALNLLIESATTDGGELFEARGYSGLHYHELSNTSGQSAVTSLDYNAKMVGDPFEPTTDDQHVRNDVQVSQRNGGVARSFLASGPLSVQPPPSGIGAYTSSITVNTSQENPQLQRTAEWLVHLGTDGSTRFKTLTTNLAAVPNSAATISDIDIGQRIRITNPPTWASGTGPIDLYVIGTDETIGDVVSSEWTYTLNCIPFRPYQVFTPSGNTSGEFGVLDFTAATLNAGYTSGATSIVIASAYVGDFPVSGSCPFDINLAGERVTVTAVGTPSGGLQTLTVTRSVNGVVKAQAAGTAVNVWQPAYLGLN